MTCAGRGVHRAWVSERSCMNREGRPRGTYEVNALLGDHDFKELNDVGVAQVPPDLDLAPDERRVHFLHRLDRDLRFWRGVRMWVRAD